MHASCLVHLILLDWITSKESKVRGPVQHFAANPEVDCYPLSAVLYCLFNVFATILYLYALRLKLYEL
jgi:hypothetical protein